ncbi:hypothetical protein CEXT_126081, partial [Caerostris extrusa]
SILFQANAQRCPPSLPTQMRLAQHIKDYPGQLGLHSKTVCSAD